MAQSGSMSHPLISSVLYLNSQQECSDKQPLGATLVLEQRFDAETGAGVPEPSRRDVVAWPAHNTLLLFDGRLSHGVLESASPLVRRTLLVNWYVRLHCPAALSCLTRTAGGTISRRACSAAARRITRGFMVWLRLATRASTATAWPPRVCPWRRSPSWRGAT